MTDSMKFGPEWLRNLSGDSCNTGGGGGGSTALSTPRYQLAEHRYGREEMLALFDRKCKPLEPLTTFSALYVEKTQPPLALIQMTEDETRMWNGGIANIGGRGRGSSVDRGGRGRSGRGSLYSSHYSRGVGFDDSGDGIRIEGQSFQGRNRPFDRSQSERGWSERNGVSDPGEWNGASSPRKDLSRGTSGSSLMEGNWRRHRGEDDDGWRKWGRSSWRESSSMDRDRLDRNEGDGDRDESRSGSGRWEHRGNHRPSHDSGHHPPPRTARAWESNHHDNHDNLPEWATENPSESGGSFDASGAFHGGMYSDEDEDGVAGASQHGRTRRVSESSASNVVKSNNKPLAFGTGSVQSLNRHTNSTVGILSKERSKPLHPLEDKDDTVVKERRCSSPTKSAPAPPTESISAKASSLTTTSDLLQKKAVGSTGVDKVETEKLQAGDTGPNKPSIGIQGKENVQTEVKAEPIIAAPNNRHVPLHAEPSKVIVAHNSGVATNVRQRTEDDLDRMKEEADALVAKLMADEESHKEKSASVPPAIGNQPSAVSSTDNQEKWFYRDPQGEVQGPFLASEMAEWCKAGYFTTGLLVRRTCDERYYTLGDLIKMCGRVPFTPGPPIPPLKLSEQVIPSVPGTVPAGIAAATGALPKTGIEDPLLLIQYQQMQLLQNQQLLLRQMRTSAIAKLSQSEHWATLSPMEQNQLILQYVVQDSEIPEVPIATNPFVPHITSQAATNPVMQLFTQMQQAKAQPEAHLPTNPHTTAPAHPATVDPIQQLIQQMGGIQNLPTVQPPNITQPPAPTQEDNPIKSLLRQLNVNANGHPQTPHIDTVWPQPPPQMAPQFNAQNWLAQVGPIPTMPPGQLSGSLWDMHAKEMKTEQQILEEQNLKLQEDRKKEELRKQEELQRQAEEENAKRKQKEEQARQAEEAKRKDEERKRKEEEKKRKEEEKRKQEEELKKREERKRKEEEKKREEKKKQEEENLRKKQEEEKRKREELKKQEEKQKREEEKKRKLEEEQRKQEEERLRKEAEAQRQAEAEEQARRAEQRRREAEALRKLQERSKAPWAQAPRAPVPAAQASLAEIQRLEREKKAEEQRLQQVMQQQLAQQKAVEAAQESLTADSSKRLQFKWAEKAITNKHLQVKSLAQIQQEEQERITKVKQQERERQEKAGQKESASVLQNAGIWGTASQCLNWANSSTSSGPAWSNAAATGFWDDPIPIRASATVKQPVKQAATATKSASSQHQQQQYQQQQQQQQQQPQQLQQQQQQNNKASKNKNKRDEEVVKKLFEQNTAKTDEFTQWCNKALTGIQASVDIPTFVGFLRDIESAYEVKEYIRVYLGDNKQSTEFAKQFLEKRSKWRSAQRPQAQADDLCKPAPAVNPNAPTEFQEVKGKSKKPKKGKMFKVDNRILGFSVTAAPDRINVGDRDYGEGV